MPATPAAPAVRATSSATEPTASDVPGDSDDGAPVGPSEGEEAAFLAEQREQGFTPATPTRGAPAATEDEDANASAPLPPLDDLVARIPPATRQMMEELFRARFITVKRVPRTAMKP